MKTSQAQRAIQVLDEVEFSLGKTTIRGKVVAQSESHYFVEVREKLVSRQAKDGMPVSSYRFTHHMIPKQECALVHRSIGVLGIVGVRLSDSRGRLAAAPDRSRASPCYPAAELAPLRFWPPRIALLDHSIP